MKLVAPKRNNDWNKYIYDELVKCKEEGAIPSSSELWLMLSGRLTNGKHCVGDRCAVALFRESITDKPLTRRMLTEKYKRIVVSSTD